MATYTFFEYPNYPETIKPKLRNVLVDLITNHNVDMFCVRHQGQFDAYVHSERKKFNQEYLQINYAVVLAHMPGKETENKDYSDTMHPEGIESIHPHYAISWHNNWMLKQSDYVFAYIIHTYGGAAQFAKKAELSGKKVIEIGRKQSDVPQK